MCTFCASSKASLVHHVCQVHRDDPHFLLYCSGCLRSYTRWDSYRKHLHRNCKELIANGDETEQLERVLHMFA